MGSPSRVGEPSFERALIAPFAVLEGVEHVGGQRVLSQLCVHQQRPSGEASEAGAGASRVRTRTPPRACD